MTRAKQYLSAFVLMTLMASTLFALGMSLRIGLWKGILAGALFGLSSGVLMALLLFPFDFFLTKGIPAYNLGVCQRRELEVNGELEDVFDRCLRMLGELEFVKSVAPFKDERYISARTKASWFSWGEPVTLRFETPGPGVVEILLTSRPFLRLTLIDFGKNFRNAEAISQAIRTRLAI